MKKTKWILMSIGLVTLISCQSDVEIGSQYCHIGLENERSPQTIALTRMIKHLPDLKEEPVLGMEYIVDDIIGEEVHYRSKIVINSSLQEKIEMLILTMGTSINIGQYNNWKGSKEKFNKILESRELSKSACNELYRKIK